MTAILVLVFVFLLIINVPVAFALMAASLAALAYGEVQLALVVQRMTTAADSFVLLAIPLFIFAGALMSRSGLAKSLFDFAQALVGFIRGGLAQVNIVASMFFGGITGAAVADTSAVGSIMIRPMLEKDYSKGLTTAVTAASSTIGVIIPPSIPMILYAVVTGTSLRQLFIAGIVPGILVGLALMVTTFFMARRGSGAPTPFSLGEVGRTLVRGLPALLMPVIVIGGILFGIVTPTEAAVLAVVYVLALGILARRLGWTEISQAALESAATTGVVMIMVAAASLYGMVLTREQVPREAAALITSLTENPVLILLLVVALYILIGTILDLGANIIIMVPVLFPVVTALGIDPVHFGIVTVIGLAIGLVTPPVGLCLFVASSISGATIAVTSRAVLPYIMSILALLLLIVLFPQIALWLPTQMQ